MSKIDTTGLPEELVEQLKLGGRTGPRTADLVLDAFPDDDSPVDLNQILVTVWRQNQTVLKRATAMAAVNSLRKEGKVRRCGRGTFVLGRDSEMAKAA